jgi:hypothetical protein
MPQTFIPLTDLVSAGPAEDEEPEHCDLCAAPVAPDHRHLLEIGKRRVLCACRACAVLFDGAVQSPRRLIPRRCLFLPELELTDMQWDSLRVPVNMAFFCQDSALDRVAAYYPSPMGATESLIERETWDDLSRSNPILQGMQPDVEALLVNRIGQGQQCFLVGIDRCFELVGIVRVLWRGFTGGSEVWQAIDGFFAELREAAHA